MRMWENADQNNSEYGHFLRSVLLRPGKFHSFYESKDYFWLYTAKFVNAAAAEDDDQLLL